MSAVHPEQSQRPQKEGWLEKCASSRIKTWNRRWFVLWPSGTVDYFHKPGDVKSKSSFQMHGLDVKPSAHHSFFAKKHAFEIIDTLRSRTVYTLAADSEEELTSWVTTLKLAGQGSLRIDVADTKALAPSLDISDILTRAKPPHMLSAQSAPMSPADAAAAAPTVAAPVAAIVQPAAQPAAQPASTIAPPASTEAVQANSAKSAALSENLSAIREELKNAAAVAQTAADAANVAANIASRAAMAAQEAVKMAYAALRDAEAQGGERIGAVQPAAQTIAAATSAVHQPAIQTTPATPQQTTQDHSTMEHEANEHAIQITPRPVHDEIKPSTVHTEPEKPVEQSADKSSQPASGRVPLSPSHSPLKADAPEFRPSSATATMPNITSATAVARSVPEQTQPADATPTPTAATESAEGDKATLAHKDSQESVKSTGAEEEAPQQVAPKPRAAVANAFRMLPVDMSVLRRKTPPSDAPKPSETMPSSATVEEKKADQAPTMKPAEKHLSLQDVMTHRAAEVALKEQQAKCTDTACSGPEHTHPHQHKLLPTPPPAHDQHQFKEPIPKQPVRSPQQQASLMPPQQRSPYLQAQGPVHKSPVQQHLAATGQEARSPVQSGRPRSRQSTDSGRGRHGSLKKPLTPTQRIQQATNSPQQPMQKVQSAQYVKQIPQPPMRTTSTPVTAEASPHHASVKLPLAVTNGDKAALPSDLKTPPPVPPKARHQTFFQDKPGHVDSNQSNSLESDQQTF